MLTKRTNILFDEDLWEKLTKLASAKKTSVGKLVREAVVEKINEEKKLSKRAKAFDSILKNRPKPVKGKIDYHAVKPRVTRI